MLDIKISGKGTEAILEAHGGIFKDGSCQDSKRISAPVDDSTEVLILPTDGYDVEVWAGFASKFGPVQISKRFLLKGQCLCRKLALIFQLGSIRRNYQHISKKKCDAKYMYSLGKI